MGLMAYLLFKGVCHKSHFPPHYPQRWGLPSNTPGRLSQKLDELRLRFQNCFMTQRMGDVRSYVEIYLKSLLLLNTGRNYANISRQENWPGDDVQNLQHFVSDSPSKDQAVFI